MTFANLTEDEILEELTYRSYRENRRLVPDISAERWAERYSTGPLLEERYQKEIADIWGTK